MVVFTTKNGYEIYPEIKTIKMPKNILNIRECYADIKELRLQHEEARKWDMPVFHCRSAILDMRQWTISADWAFVTTESL